MSKFAIITILMLSSYYFYYTIKEKQFEKSYNISKKDLRQLDQFGDYVDSLYLHDSPRLDYLLSDSYKLEVDVFLDSVFKTKSHILHDTVIQKLKNDLTIHFCSPNYSFTKFMMNENPFFSNKKYNLNDLVYRKSFSLISIYFLEKKYKKVIELFNKTTEIITIFEPHLKTYCLFDEKILLNAAFSFYIKNDMKRAYECIKYVNNPIFYEAIMIDLFNKNTFLDNALIIQNRDTLSFGLVYSLLNSYNKEVSHKLYDFDNDGRKELILSTHNGKNKGTCRVYRKKKKNRYECIAYFNQKCVIDTNYNCLECIVPVNEIPYNNNKQTIKIRLKLKRKTFKPLHNSEINKQIIKRLDNGLIDTSVEIACIEWYYNNHYNIISTKKIFEKYKNQLGDKDDYLRLTCTDNWNCFLKLLNKYTLTYFYTK